MSSQLSRFYDSLLGIASHRRIVVRCLSAVLLTMLVSGLALCQSATGQEPTGSETKQVLAVEAELESALAANDAGALDRIYSNDFTYTNEYGEVITKRRLLDQIRAGKHKVTSVDHENVRLRALSNTIVMTGISTSTIGYQGTYSSGPRRFTNVFAREGGRWLLVAHQVTNISEPRDATKANSDAEVREEILRIEADEKRAILSRDGAALDHIYASGLAWTARGELLNKQQVIHDFLIKALTNNSFVHTGIEVIDYGDTAVLTGYSTSELIYKGRILKGPRRFTDVFVQLDGRWQLVAHSVVEISNP